MPVWGVPLLWPFSDVAWAYPLVPWGDIGATIIFIAGMFAMLHWRAWTRTIATGTLGLVVGYVRRAAATGSSWPGSLPFPSDRHRLAIVLESAEEVLRD